MPFIPGSQGISDVFHSPNVFINNVETALYREQAGGGGGNAVSISLDAQYVIENADSDSVDSNNAGTVGNSINGTIANSGLSSTSTVLTGTTVGTIDHTAPPSIPSTVYRANWDQFTADNIPYDTLMITDKTSLATFTTKTTLWNNQPHPLGPHTPYQGTGDNKFIKAQDYYVGGVRQGTITVPQILHNLSNLAKNVYEPIKQQYPNVVVTNTFRQSPPGGKSQQAQHGLGMAMDLIFPGVRPGQYVEIAKWIRDNVPIDQLLQEKSGGTIWIHVSHYSGYGYQVPAGNKVANCIVAPQYAFIPGLASLT